MYCSYQFVLNLVNYSIFSCIRKRRITTTSDKRLRSFTLSLSRAHALSPHIHSNNFQSQCSQSQCCVLLLHFPAVRTMQTGEINTDSKCLPPFVYLVISTGRQTEPFSVPPETGHNCTITHHEAAGMREWKGRRSCGCGTWLKEGGWWKLVCQAKNNKKKRK